MELSMRSVEEIINEYVEQIHDQEEKFKELIVEDAVLISGINIFSGVEEIYGEFVKNILHKKILEIKIVKEKHP